MKLKIVIHEAEEGGYWAEVPAIPGCATQGDTIEELLKNVREAVEACLSVSMDQPSCGDNARVMEIAF
ncbi:MAG: type II toxin-antitoxin system HicB family antitoxin [Deltaproteobacteria bacterium]|nr:type II toxin-antitoxin system HicB family antitoxin [Deltaproteobacteria bacterium]